MDKELHVIDGLREYCEKSELSMLEKAIAEEILFKAEDLSLNADFNLESLNEKRLSNMVNTLVTDDKLWEKLNLRICELLRDNETQYYQNKELNEKSKVKVYSAVCIGGYNDTLCYDVEIGFDGKKETVSLEKHYHDLQKPNVAWEINSNIELSVIDIEKIIQTVSQDPPAIYSDRLPKQYEQEKDDEIEIDDEIID